MKVDFGPLITGADEIPFEGSEFRHTSTIQTNLRPTISHPMGDHTERAKQARRLDLLRG